MIFYVKKNVIRILLDYESIVGVVGKGFWDIWFFNFRLEK